MSSVIIGKEIWINGVKIPAPPCKSNSTNITTINDKVYVNGYEYKNGEWKRTLAAIWHWLF